MDPLPETVVLAGEIELISPDLVAVMTVLLAFTIETDENVAGLPFLDKARVAGADKVQTPGEGEEPGEGEAVTVADGDGEGDAVTVGDGDADGDASTVGEGEASEPGEGEGLGETVGLASCTGVPFPPPPATAVDGFEFKTTSPIALS